MSIETIARCTAETHAFLRANAHRVAGEFVNPTTLRGLCATGALLLIDRLAQEGLVGELVAARSEFKNVFHYWVLVEGVHADPTYGQFDSAQPWRVATDAPSLVFGDWVGRPTTWAVETEVVLHGAQHPSQILPALQAAA